MAKKAEIIRMRRVKTSPVPQPVEGASTASMGTKPCRWVITPDMDRAILEAYQNHVGKHHGESVTANLAHKLGIPKWKLIRYAVKQGYVACLHKKEPNWHPREISILKANAHLSPERLRVLLAREGFNRSVNGIVLKKKRLGGKALVDGYSCCQLSKRLGIDAKGITRWIELGYIQAEQRGTARMAVQGGDIWFISNESVKSFLKEHIDLVDFRKLDKYWLVSFL
ncbi:MAG: hypothetical protein ABFD97_12855 [Syntrophobacter sp.]